MIRRKSSISFSEETRELVNKFVSRYPDKHNFSSTVEEIINDYAALLIRTKRELKELFSDEEMNYIYDMLNGSIIETKFVNVRIILVAYIEDSERYHELSKKWGVDYKKFLGKVEKLSEFQAYGIAKMSNFYWEKNKDKIDENRRKMEEKK